MKPEDILLAIEGDRSMQTPNRHDLLEFLSRHFIWVVLVFTVVIFGLTIKGYLGLGQYRQYPDHGQRAGRDGHRAGAVFDGAQARSLSRGHGVLGGGGGGPG